MHLGLSIIFLSRLPPVGDPRMLVVLGYQKGASVVYLQQRLESVSICTFVIVKQVKQVNWGPASADLVVSDAFEEADDICDLLDQRLFVHFRALCARHCAGRSQYQRQCLCFCTGRCVSICTFVLANLCASCVSRHPCRRPLPRPSGPSPQLCRRQSQKYAAHAPT